MSTIEHYLKNISLLGGSTTTPSSKKKNNIIELILIGLGVIIVILILIKLFLSSDNHSAYASSQATNKELICKSGQGDKDNIIRSTIDNTFEKCENECRSDKNCKAFDYTQEKKENSCRLFNNMDYESDPGENNRLHCSI